MSASDIAFGAVGFLGLCSLPALAQCGWEMFQQWRRDRRGVA